MQDMTGEITEGFSVEPSVMMNLNTNSSRMFDINVLMKLYGESDYFAAGINYRTAKVLWEANS